MVKIIGYCRVNRPDGNLEYQRQRIESYANEKQLPFEIHHEIKSGIDTEMEVLDRAIEAATNGDIVVVTDRSRLGRDSIRYLMVMQKLKEKNIELVSLDSL